MEGEGEEEGDGQIYTLLLQKGQPFVDSKKRFTLLGFIVPLVLGRR